MHAECIASVSSALTKKNSSSNEYTLLKLNTAQHVSADSLSLFDPRGYCTEIELGDRAEVLVKKLHKQMDDLEVRQFIVARVLRAAARRFVRCASPRLAAGERLRCRASQRGQRIGGRPACTS
jgi:hypothetical protein